MVNLDVPYNSGMTPNDVHLFCSLQHFLTEKLFNDFEEVKACLNHCFAKKTVVRYNSSMHIHKQHKKDISLSKTFTSSIKVWLFFVSW